MNNGTVILGDKTTAFSLIEGKVAGRDARAIAFYKIDQPLSDRNIESVEKWRELAGDKEPYFTLAFIDIESIDVVIRSLQHLRDVDFNTVDRDQGIKID